MWPKSNTLPKEPFSVLKWKLLSRVQLFATPRILEGVAYSVCNGSSRPRNWTRVFCIAGRFFTIWAIREALISGLPLWLSWLIIHLQCGRPGSIPGLGRSPGEGKGYPLQYSGLENSMDYSPCGLKELDTIVRLSLSLFKFESITWTTL